MQPEKPIIFTYIESTHLETEEEKLMRNLNTLMHRIFMDIEGVTDSALVDGAAGKLMKHEGNHTDFDTLTHGIVAIYNFKARISRALQTKEPMEYFWVTLQNQHHVFYPIPMRPHMFIYIAVDKTRTMPTNVITKLKQLTLPTD